MATYRKPCAYDFTVLSCDEAAERRRDEEDRLDRSCARTLAYFGYRPETALRAMNMVRDIKGLPPLEWPP